MLDDFIWRAILGGIAIALVAGPLGCFVVWRRMAYFGDSLAHSALLGVALGFLMGINITLGIMVSCVFFAVLLLFMQKYGQLTIDAVLGILSHSLLALGLIAISLMDRVRIDLFGYLFGDILSIQHDDVFGMFAVSFIGLIALTIMWRQLLAYTYHDQLAQAEGVRVWWIYFAFLVLIALVIAVAMQVIGILLITSLLILPAATAFRFSRSPEQMALLAGLIGSVNVAVGIGASIQWDIPSGPAIVAVGTLFFVFTVFFSLFSRR